MIEICFSIYYDMSSNTKIKLPKDLTKVDANELGEFIWWSIHLSIAPEKLLAIVNDIGESAKEIRKFIRSNRLK